jgi:endonuclease-3
VPEGGALTVLEQFVFALCRENSTLEQAQQAYNNLRSQFFDWNEVRVSSTRELEEAMAGLSDTESRAQRLIAFLQEVFEKTFSFDMEDAVQKKGGLKQASKVLLAYGASNEYVEAWVVQRALGGHALPVDAPTLRCARRLGLVDASVEDPEAARATLEHLVPKAKGQQFTDAISEIAERHCWEDEPQCAGCPLNRDCPMAHETLGDQLATARTARTKPR